MARIFHKYRADAAFTEQLITNGEVFLATANQLNDPFECSIEDIGQDWLDTKAQADMESAISSFVLASKQSQHAGLEFFGLGPDATEEAIKGILSAGDLESSYVGMRDFIKQRTGYPPSDCRFLFRRIDQQLMATGIFSMSANPDQPLMWAHYADSHRGLAIGFRAVANSKLADPHRCRPVIYSDELPTISDDGLKTTLSMSADREGRIFSSGVTISFEDETFQRMVTTKPTCWKYEDEVRYIEPGGGVMAWPGELAECTFGWRCPDARRQHYIALLKEHVPNDVLLFEMQPKPGSNALIRVPMNPPAISGRKRHKLKTKRPQRELKRSVFNAKMAHLLGQRLFHEVLDHANENLRKQPDAPDLLYWKASALGHLEDHGRALQIFHGLTVSHPEWADVWYGAGVAASQVGRQEEAVAFYEQAYKLEPDDPSHALNLGSFLVVIPGRKEEGIACLRHAERLGHRRASRLISEAETRHQD